MSTIRLARSVDRALDFYGASSEALDDPDLCRHLWDDILAAGFTLVMPPQFHRFAGGGGGISFLAMLTESHAAIHTAPEKEGCLEITIHTCEVEGVVSGKTPAEKTGALVQIWKDRFKPARVLSFGDRVRADQVA